MRDADVLIGKLLCLVLVQHAAVSEPDVISFPTHIPVWAGTSCLHVCLKHFWVTPAQVQVSSVCNSADTCITAGLLTLHYELRSCQVSERPSCCLARQRMHRRVFQ